MSSPPRHAHDEVDPGHAQEGQQPVHVVLIGLGMVGVADVHPHRQAEQFAAEVILQPRPGDLLAVIEVFGADEPHHGVHQERPEGPRHGVGARLQRLLVDPVMGARRQGRALARLEIHHIVAEGIAPQAERRFVGLRAEGQG